MEITDYQEKECREAARSLWGMCKQQYPRFTYRGVRVAPSTWFAKGRRCSVVKEHRQYRLSIRDSEGSELAYRVCAFKDIGAEAYILMTEFLERE